MPGTVSSSRSISLGLLFGLHSALQRPTGTKQNKSHGKPADTLHICVQQCMPMPFFYCANRMQRKWELIMDNSHCGLRGITDNNQFTNALSVTYHCVWYHWQVKSNALWQSQTEKGWRWSQTLTTNNTGWSQSQNTSQLEQDTQWMLRVVYTIHKALLFYF